MKAAARKREALRRRRLLIRLLILTAPRRSLRARLLGGPSPLALRSRWL